MQANLPNFFQFKSASDLIRIGNKNDGGYLISQSDIDKSDVLFSFGINNDWSIDEDFILNKKDIKIFAYDASISQNKFFKDFIKSLARIDKPKIALSSLRTYLKYRSFSQIKNIIILRSL